jgi:hypothetical protein
MEPRVQLQPVLAVEEEAFRRRHARPATPPVLDKPDFPEDVNRLLGNFG